MPLSIWCLFQILSGRTSVFAATDILVTTATTAATGSGYFSLKLLSVSSVCVVCVWLPRGYISEPDGVGWHDEPVGVCCFHRCSRRPHASLSTHTHTHTHTHTCSPPLCSVLLSNVSYAVNQQACRPVAIPPDCQTQLAYLRTVCACVR